jgi:hypothetical protein
MSANDPAMISGNAAKQASDVGSASRTSLSLADFPAPLRAVIATVCKRARLWKHERADVEAELAAHFHDGLAQGTAPDKLLADFGDPKAAAKLIRRGKIRNRPLWWQVQRRLGQALAVALLMFLGLAVVHTIRFYSGSPTITIRPLDVVNRETIALAEPDRAWPTHRAAFLALDLTRDQFRELGDLEPDVPPPPALAEALARNAVSMASFRAAAARPGLGYLAGVTEDPELAAKCAALVDTAPGSQSSTTAIQADPDNPEALFILLSHLQPMRHIARLLRADAIDAIHAGDASRLHADLAAITSTARHMRSPDTYISSLVSVALTHLTCELVRDVLELRPALLTDAQLADLAHRLAVLGGPTDFLSLRGERLFFRDSIQRLYTDDGNGNGRLTASGSAYFNKTASFGVDRANAGMLIASAFLADRKQVTDAYDSIIDRAESSIGVPLWIPVKESADIVLERYSRTTLQRIRYMPVALFAPALDRARYAAHEIASARDATLTVIALELHRRRNGLFPDALDVLIPGLLPTLPLDNADGQPLRYRRPGPRGGSYLLYAIGSDLRDDAGKPATTPGNAAAIRSFGRSGKLQTPCDDVLFPRPRFAKDPNTTP